MSASETRQYRTYGAELRLLVGRLAGLDPARVVMESTGVFWKSVQRALSAAGVERLGCQCQTRQARTWAQDGCLRQCQRALRMRHSEQVIDHNM